MTDAPRIPLPSGEGTPAARARRYNPELTRTIAAVHAAGDALGGLDGITTELVRLRCAQHHDCHT